MSKPTQAGLASVTLLLADISGYTAFLQLVAEAHSRRRLRRWAGAGCVLLRIVPARRDHRAARPALRLSGPDVVMAHRLLKNHATDGIGHPAYALISEAAGSRLAVPDDGARELTETYERYAPIALRAYPLR